MESFNSYETETPARSMKFLDQPNNGKVLTEILLKMAYQFNKFPLIILENTVYLD